jgi:hypothetical protein
MRILFIEDHPHKRQLVVNYLKETFPNFKVVIKGSYNSGLKELITNSEEYDLLLLDISMPNYDISPEESGGDFLPLAGKLILKEMYLRDISTKAVVISMHGSFKGGTKLTELDDELKTEYCDNYIGYVYFSQISTEWKEQLKKIIDKIQS